MPKSLAVSGRLSRLVLKVMRLTSRALWFLICKYLRIDSIDTLIVDTTTQARNTV